VIKEISEILLSLVGNPQNPPQARRK